MSATAAETRPWWTAADQAELDVLIGEYVEAAWPHRGCRIDRCPSCRALTEAFTLIEDWIERRSRLSRAAFLRQLDDRALNRADNGSR